MSKEKNDFTLKIFALVIAIILWAFVIEEENPLTEREYRNIPVSLNNISSLEEQNLVVTDPVNPTVDITIVAKRQVLSQIDDSDILAAVDLDGYEEGTFKVPVIVELPSQVRLANISSKDILFKFEKIIRKEVPILVETVGDLPEGYELGEANHKPHSLYIEGPRSLVESVFKVVASVELTDKTEDISANVPLKVLNEEGEVVRGLNVEQASVDIYIPVYKTKEVPINLQTINIDDELLKDISIEPKKVKIKGRRELIEGIKELKTKPVRKEDIKNGLELELVVPEGIAIVDKEAIKLKIGNTSSGSNDNSLNEKTINYGLNNIDFQNLGEGLEIDLETNKEDLKLIIKSKENLDNLSIDDFTIKSDLSGLEAGIHRLKLSVEALEGFNLELVPDEIEIDLLGDE